jgi:hypothetical protein
LERAKDWTVGVISIRTGSSVSLQCELDGYGGVGRYADLIDNEGARYQRHHSLLFRGSVSLVLMAAGYTEAPVDDEGGRRKAERKSLCQ